MMSWPFKARRESITACARISQQGAANEIYRVGQGSPKCAAKLALQAIARMLSARAHSTRLQINEELLFVKS